MSEGTSTLRRFVRVIDRLGQAVKVLSTPSSTSTVSPP
jgi:hypothetical protein